MKVAVVSTKDTNLSDLRADAHVPTSNPSPDRSGGVSAREARQMREHLRSARLLDQARKARKLACMSRDLNALMREASSIRQALASEA